MKRIYYLDYVKGIAILLMLWGHTNPPALISNWIFAFHMPLFFIVGGILVWNKTTMLPDLSVEEFKQILFKRIKQLGVPYFVFSFLLLAYFTIMKMIAHLPCDFMESILPVITFQGIESLWFLPCFFFGEILMYVTLLPYGWLKYIRFVFFCIVFLFVVMRSESMPIIWWQRSLVKYAVSFVFVYSGYLLAKYRIINRLPLWCASALFLLFSYLCLYNGHVGIGGLVFNNGIMFFVNAIIMSVSLMSICSAFENRKGGIFDFMSFFGQCSIVVLCTNNFIIEFIRLADYKLTGNLLLSGGMLVSIIFTVILIVLEIPLLYMAKGRLGFVFGKNQR